MSFSVSVIVSTYNSPEWLEKVLWGFENQNFRNYQLVLADDGSTTETADLIACIRKNNILNLEHVWHEDMGCQKAVILNKAVMKASGDYLIFTEGDCIPRHDFVHAHEKRAKQGYFLSGDFAKLPRCCSVQVNKEEIMSGDAFDIFWLTTHGYPDHSNKMRLLAKGWWAKFLDFAVQTPNKWNHHNSSGWKSDILSINGFDERMQYRDGDCEMGERMKNSGIKARRVNYTAASVHLYPGKQIQTDESKILNQSIRDATRRDQSRYTKFGIFK
ncbi:MAG: putative glycosyl transferase [Burkholderiaceae bacterium]|nr:putative glycosyl transferase [Burkholderiaceae bacterium]